MKSACFLFTWITNNRLVQSFSYTNSAAHAWWSYERELIDAETKATRPHHS